MIYGQLLEHLVLPYCPALLLVHCHCCCFFILWAHKIYVCMYKSELITTANSLNVATLSILFPQMHNLGMSFTAEINTR